MLPTEKKTRVTRVPSTDSAPPVLTDDYHPFEIPSSSKTVDALSWKELCNDEREMLVSKFRRTDEVTKMLETVERARAAAYVSFAAKICAEFLGAPTFITLTGQKDVDISGIHKNTIVRNRFPYHLEDGIAHYLIFSTYPMNDDELDEICNQACDFEIEYTRFAHDINHRAVGGDWLYTVHLFVRHKDPKNQLVPPELQSPVLSPRREQKFETFDKEFSLDDNDSDDPLLSEKPGLRMVSWSTIENAEENPGGAAELSTKLSRRPSVQKMLRVFDDEVEGNFVDREAKILAVDLELNAWITEDGKVQCNVPFGLKSHKLVKHDFPYELADGIEHHVLYATYHMDKKEAAKLVEKELRGYNFHFQSPRGSSMKNVWEMNVFAKKKNRVETIPRSEGAEGCSCESVFDSGCRIL